MSEVVRYSKMFKLRLAGDMASGKYASLDEARRGNGIPGSSTPRKCMSLRAASSNLDP
ncbi:MAG: hypothetical protein LBO04_02545 [Spirochaetaceae bacterium]|jgi:hypothetical protein|nr:hypothetical protein [Spirochaetaceae bacterium]